jgi:tyrosyl-tRNA synthetase
MHPRDAKVKLACEIIRQYHGEKEAEKARLEFERVFAKKEAPMDLQEFRTDKKKTVLNILLESGLVQSGNEARRLLKQGAVAFNEEKIDKDDHIIDKEGILKVGSRRFLKVTV